ncbi:MAG TPA: hypothetical protein VK880_10625, partial [Anaerolineales bacterium]|nr:hypothetical protein [Anaerolineales bacterium]
MAKAAYDLLRRSNRHNTQPLYPLDDEGEEIDAPYWMADPSASVQDQAEKNEFSKTIHELLDE